MKKLFAWSCAAMLFSAMGCAEKKEEKAVEKFQVINPIVLDTLYYKEYVADIHAVKNVEIRARIHGVIEKIYVDEGQTVRKGQILFSINDVFYREELAKAKAQLKNIVAETKAAEVELLNVKVLVEKKVVASTELEKAQAKFDALKAKVEEAQSHEVTASLNLSYTKIKAPFDGILDRIPLKAGSLVEEGTLLTTISDNSEVFAYFSVSENEYLNFVLDKNKNSGKNEVSLLLANASMHPYTGKIETIEGEFNKATGNISFRARFPNPQAILKHGSSGKVRLKIDLKNVMIIPQKSTFEIQENTFVYVVDSNNVVQMKSLTPALSLPYLYVIGSGLTTSDKVLYEGIQRVKEGDKIIPDPVSMRKILAQQSE